MIGEKLYQKGPNYQKIKSIYNLRDIPLKMDIIYKRTKLKDVNEAEIKLDDKNRICKHSSSSNKYIYIIYSRRM